MKVKSLIEILQKLNPEAEVVIHKDVLNYGVGRIDIIKTGLYEETEYGNDFLPDQALIVNPSQVKAICLYPEDKVTENNAKDMLKM